MVFARKKIYQCYVFWKACTYRCSYEEHVFTAYSLSILLSVLFLKYAWVLVASFLFSMVCFWKENRVFLCLMCRLDSTKCDRMQSQSLDPLLYHSEGKHVWYGIRWNNLSKFAYQYLTSGCYRLQPCAKVEVKIWSMMLGNMQLSVQNIAKKCSMSTEVDVRMYYMKKTRLTLCLLICWNQACWLFII